jgi:putative acetyltransferase
MAVHNARVTPDAAEPLGEEAMRLLPAMRAETLQRYWDVLDASTSPPTNDLLADRSAFLTARLDGKPVGCAALRPMEEAAKVRRRYVAPSVRRQGIGRRRLTALEQMASLSGCHTLRLAPGARQPEAIALCESLGFHRIPPYGGHTDDTLSICFQRSLIADSTRGD